MLSKSKPPADRVGAGARICTKKVISANTLTPAAIADAGRELNHIAAETARLEERWLALSGEIETMAAE